MSLFNMLSKSSDDASISRKDYEKHASKLLEKAQESAEKNDIDNAAWMYHRLSVLARRAGEWDDGINYALQSAEYSESTGNAFNAGWSYRSAALAAKGKGDYENTIDYAMRGARKFEESGSVYAAQWCYKTAAQASKDSGRPDKAIKLYDKACEIEHDDDLKSEVNRLKHSISHPRVDQYADKEVVSEGEKVRFEIVVENHTKETITNVVVGDRDAKITHDIEKLKPGEVNVFSYETSGTIGKLSSPYNFITWNNNEGELLDFEIRPVSVIVRPSIQITPHLHPDPVAGKTSKLVILVKNLSSTPLQDLKVDVDFDEGVSVPHQNPKEFDKLSPGEEYGAAWSMKVGIPGRHKIAEGRIIMHDEKGRKYGEEIKPVIASVLASEPQPKKVSEAATKAEENKKHIDNSISAYPISEKLYVELEKKMFHHQKGYTFRGLKGGVVLKHIMENCKDMSLVAEHKFEKEVMVLYSFKLEGKHYLLTAVIKKDEELAHLVFKLYSEKEEDIDRNLEKIADIIRHTIVSETDAHEVEKVEIKKVINIIDSVVQRSRIGSGEEGKATKKVVNVKDSVVQRTGT